MIFKYKQIINIFTNLKRSKQGGIWFDGIENEGEFKKWHSNGQLVFHCHFNKYGETEGEYKRWYSDGRLWIHCFHINNYKYRGEYKEWDENDKLEKYEIYNDDGTLKEKIL